MQLEDALKLSAVERALDDDAKRPCAKRPYPTNFISNYYYQDLLRDNKNRDKNKYIIAFSSDDFLIVWADTLLPISTYFHHVDWDNEFDLIDKEDWEPI